MYNLNDNAMKNFTFEELPEAVGQLYEKLENIERLLQEKIAGTEKKDDQMSISGAAKFLKLSISTIYTKVCKKEIPVNKQGKRLYFYRSELISWIRSGRRKTIDEIKRDVDKKGK